MKISASFLRHIFLLFFFALAHIAATAQNVSSIRLNQQNCILNTDQSSWSRNFAATTGLKKTLVLQLESGVSAVQKDELAESGFQFLEYLGQNCYSVWVTPNTRWTKLDAIKGMAIFLPEYKIAPIVLEQSKSKQRLSLLISFHQSVNAVEAKRRLLAVGAQLVPSSWMEKGYYTVELLRDQLWALAADEELHYISLMSGNVPLDKDSKGLQAVSVLNMPAALGGQDLRGKGIMMGVGDNASGIYHIDQRDRTINYNHADKDQHGVFVQSIAAGDGIMNWAGQGVASEAQSLNFYFDEVIMQKQEMYKGYNMTITNNSYAAYVGSCSFSGTYDIISQYLDSVALVNKEQIDVFAVGNDGRLVCGAYPPGFYNVCGGFQTAKNVISVGATNRELVLAEGSSRGPVRDGRLKPEIVASGIDIMGAIPENTYKFDRGTSYAAPQVAGVLALLSERYKQLNAGANPRGDLMKALVVNGATDMGRPGPDFQFGFGFLNASRSLAMVDDKRYVLQSMAAGALPKSFTINVPPNTAQLKVMLYYHDPKASAAAPTQLVNDLDLKVVEPSGSFVHLPMVLDPSPTGVTKFAAEGLDRTNNIEQVLVDNPTPGTYTVTVSQFTVPLGPQDYVVVYDFVPNEVKLRFPHTNAAVADNTDLYIYWDAQIDMASMAKIDFSADNGMSWVTIAPSVPPTHRHFKWSVPTLNSGECKVRVSRGSLIDESGPFVINTKPTLSLTTQQCPGYIAVNWTSVPAAEKYYLLLKKGPHFQIVDSVNAPITTYVYKGLNPNETYYLSVQPVLDGRPGFRANALVRQPNSGSCIGFPDGDLSLLSITAPSTGRLATSSELKKNSAIRALVRNQDNDPVANYQVSYQVNGGTWKTVAPFSIAANSTANILVDTFDFSDTIAYQLTLALRNLDKVDPVVGNDTLVKHFKHIPNRKIRLTEMLVNHFDSLPNFTQLRDTMGFSADGYWDFFTNQPDTGRLRSRIPGSKLVTSLGSVSMDVQMNHKSTVNYLTGTFNLSNYDTSEDEVRFDFDYLLRGMPVLRDSNKVWVRGSDLQAWLPVYPYFNTPDTSKMLNSGTISLREILRNNGQNFSTSTQIRFGQFDTTLIVNDLFGAGITIDNVHLYKVLKDVQIARVVAPERNTCNISSSDVVVVVKNGTVNTVKGIDLGYSLDGGSPVLASITDSLKGDDSIVYRFAVPLKYLSIGLHRLKVWVNTFGDDFPGNDTIANYEFYNAPFYTEFPYLQDFELDNGGWYAQGRNSSWEYGAPDALNIKRAASGSNAWKTNLRGVYNGNELSYLLSPCFATIGMSKPMLSFSVAFDLERCTAPCDRVFMEYSVDNGDTWSRLGNPNEGFNWYNNEVHNAWNGTETRWHVASIPLPRSWSLKLRFVLITDMGVAYDGIAIDDIHIFDLQHQMATLGSLAERNGSATVNTANKELLLQDQEILAGIQAPGGNLGKVDAVLYAQDTLQDQVARQYTLPRSYVISSERSPSLPMTLQLFVADEEVRKMWSDTSCPSCTRPADIYRNGITRYNTSDVAQLDHRLDNNIKGSSRFFDYKLVKWVPYERGYYAQFKTDELGEFWFNNGGIVGALSINTVYATLNARRMDDQHAELNWSCNLDTFMKSYTLYRSTDSITFSEIVKVPAEIKHPHTYLYLDQPNISQGQKVFYKLQGTTRNDDTFYTNTVSVLWDKGDQLLGIYPNPSSDGQFMVKWTAAVGTNVQYYLVDISGKSILQGTLTSSSWLNEAPIRLPFLAKGVYFLKLIIGTNQYKEKVIFK